RPPADVDILFLMPASVYYRYDQYQGNGQSALLQDVRRVLQERYPTTEKIRGDGQVVVVPFSNGYTVELLPACLPGGPRAGNSLSPIRTAAAAGRSPITPLRLKTWRILTRSARVIPERSLRCSRRGRPSVTCQSSPSCWSYAPSTL